MNSPIWMLLFFASQAQKNAGEAVQPIDTRDLVFAALFAATIIVLRIVAWVVEKREGAK